MDNPPLPAPAPSLDRRFLLGGLAGAAGITAIAAMAKGGPLTPPAGAVASTGKTLTDIEPRRAVNAANTPPSATALFRITQPGSYYLTGNIQGVAGRHGIEIASSGVALDLNGFDVVGVGGAGNFDGVRAATLSLRNIAVRNGSVRGWDRHGVDFSTALALNAVVENLAVCENGGNGVFVYRTTTVRACTVSLSGGAGIVSGPAGTIERCASYNNGTGGISVQEGSTVHACTAAGNTGSGISSSGGSVISGCASDDNSSYGISAGLGGSVTACVCLRNVVGNIVASHGSTVRGNTCRGEASGSADGIRVVGGDAFIEGNTVSICGTGMSVLGDRNRIDGNSINNCGVGLSVTGTDNLVIRNSARSSSPNYSIVAGNCVAPRVTVANSDGWAGIANANHPWANLSY